jgi:hypothetical protein
MECPYCKKTYPTIYLLKNHQSRTKACLTIQEQMGVPMTKKVYECTQCKKQLTSKTSLKYHTTICTHPPPTDLFMFMNELKDEITTIHAKIDDKIHYIKDLKDKIEQLSVDVSTYKKDTTNNTLEEIKKIQIVKRKEDLLRQVEQLTKM